MHISQVELENIKGFRDGPQGLNLDFTRRDGSLPRWIVLAGRNGAGKSTLLQAIALAVAGPEVTGKLQSSFTDWIHEGGTTATVTARLRRGRDDQYLSSDGSEGVDRPWVSMTWMRDARGPEPLRVLGLYPDPSSSGLRSLIARNEVAHEMTQTGPWAPNPHGWFSAGYGPFRRLPQAAFDGSRSSVAAGRLANLANLFWDEMSLADSVPWLQQIYLRRLEGDADAALVERAMIGLLNDGLLPEGMRVTRITSDGLWVRPPQREELPLRILSDGYRTVAALVLDIAKQLLQAFGTLDFTENGGRVRILHSGVVLIDEIDLHMHISWQQQIGFWLKEHFPNIQFIVSTHSPFICQAADERGLVLLPSPREDRPAVIVTGELFNRVVNGSVDDAVITDLFGMESPYSRPAAELRDEVAALEAIATSDEMTDSQEERLETLRGKLPRTVSADVADALNRLTGGSRGAED
ncbi:energy-coupling factor transporter ATP-binding protein EcfA2 [Allocatelliglobosispora scoriae]|uniref:Energy-coupling factor transporter ATP-binding protein EcfA2 n=1 Tax=Allocatelliglobosispora scoriae TaxID=643052 RepID=A0A841BZ63_9ACTN|nr:AAA family ATPase [Allocatelliglobosispora scoriae]MBB5872876.1 energy-coupling factor transporter ATP-binding protein EcfA2 [Allocatelliglobosispora scoriae]